MTLTVVVMDAWPGTGMGHSFLGTAIWMRVSATFGLNLRFAYCIPKNGITHITKPFVHRKTLPICSANTFDLHDYLRRADDVPLKATAYDFKNIDRVLSKPTSLILDELLKTSMHSTRTIGLHYAHIKMVRSLARNSSSLRYEMNQLVYPWKLPPIRCSVGLHFRTMKLDDPKCTVFSNKCRMRRLLCPMDTLINASNKCASTHRFVTSDSSDIYEKLTKWVNMGDRAVKTWNTDAVVPHAEFNKTIQAFMILSSCSKMIVSPVPSQFSLTASMKAGVPLQICC